LKRATWEDAINLIKKNYEKEGIQKSGMGTQRQNKASKTGQKRGRRRPYSAHNEGENKKLPEGANGDYH